MVLTLAMVQIDWVDAQQLEPDSKESDAKAHEEAWARLREVDGILVPGMCLARRCDPS